MFTLITGASSGIGFELAHEYAKNKHDLILTARSTSKLLDLKNNLENKYKIKVEVITCDLSLPHSADELYNQIQLKNIKLNGLVNNAGFGDLAEFEKSDLDKILRMIQLNITTLTELTRLFINDLILNAPSKILNVSSTAAFQAGPLMTVYYATKAYVLSFSEGLYCELKNKNVSVTALCPGPTTSGFQLAANYTNTSYLEKIKFPSAKDVAEFGYQKTMKKKSIAIYGIINNIIIFTERILPRSTVRNAVYALQKKRQP